MFWDVAFEPVIFIWIIVYFKGMTAAGIVIFIDMVLLLMLCKKIFFFCKRSRSWTYFWLFLFIFMNFTLHYFSYAWISPYYIQYHLRLRRNRIRILNKLIMIPLIISSKNRLIPQLLNSKSLFKSMKTNFHPYLIYMKVLHHFIN